MSVTRAPVSCAETVGLGIELRRRSVAGRAVAAEQVGRELRLGRRASASIRSSIWLRISVANSTPATASASTADVSAASKELGLEAWHGHWSLVGCGGSTSL